jgi:NO-binding membrane sensor protein with MHYT domain
MVGDIFERLFRWLFFSVGVSLIPLIYRTLRTSSAISWNSFEASISHGELSLITAALCAAAIGEVMGTSRSLRFPKLICSAACVSVLMLAAFHFGDVSAHILIKDPSVATESSQIIKQSLTLFYWALPSCAGCVAISEVDRAI